MSLSLSCCAAMDINQLKVGEPTLDVDNGISSSLLEPVLAARTHAAGQRIDNDDDDDDEIPASATLAKVELAKTILRKLFLHLKPSYNTNSIISGRNVKPFDLGDDIKQPNFVMLIREFLRQQLHPASNSSDSSDATPPPLPFFNDRISTYSSAVATFQSPSDLCSVKPRRQRIHAVSNWRNREARYDCMLVETDAEAEAMLGMDIARARMFFSFTFCGKFYPCVLAHWYSRVDDAVDENTRMWVVKQDLELGKPCAAVLHLDSILRAVHLVPVYGTSTFIPRRLSPAHSLDIFKAFYINKYADHHSFEVIR